MSKSDSASHKKERHKAIRWVVTIFLITLVVSAAISLVSEEVMAGSGTIVACFILLAIVLVGILFDIIGVAVTSADDKPFHSMAARKVPGAKEAIRLLRNAERVSSICNDVIGDICGVVSGAASATIASRILMHFTFSWPRIVTLVMSALVASLTVGGKAFGKSFAIESSTQIVHTVGKVIAFFHRLPGRVCKKKNKR